MVIAEIPSVSSAPLDIVDLRHKRRESVWSQMVATAEARGVISESEVVVAALTQRERLGSTLLGKGVVVTGALSIGVRENWIVLGRSERGLDWHASDEVPVQLVVCVLTPAHRGVEAHVGHMLRAAHALRLQRTRARLMDADVVTALALLEGSSA